MQDIAFYSFIVGSIANLILLVLLATNWQKNGVVLLFASALITSVVWNTLLAINTQTAFLSSIDFLPFEILRYGLWTLLILKLSTTVKSAIKHPANIANILIFSATIIAAVYFHYYTNDNSSLLENTIDSILLLLVITIIGGIYFIENLYRGISQQERWSLKLLCLGLFSIFVYDLCLFSYLLLFKDINLLVWSTRGIVSAISIPLMALAMTRNPNWSLNIFVSRQVVTTSFTLLFCGVYLAALVFASIYVNSVAGSLAEFFLALLIFSGLICLVLLLLSKNLRYQVSIFISKHFFKNKYDYRIEWLKLINTISNQNGNLSLHERIIKVLADLAQTNGGILWRDSTYGRFEIVSQWNMKIDSGITFGKSHTLCQSLSEGNIVIFDPKTANQYTKIPSRLTDINQLWLAIPLIHEDKLAGFVILDKSLYNIDPNWEDLDIFKTVGRQLGSYLMEYIHATALSEAKQFEAFHQTTTFIIHDLRNLISQQSLLVKNAIKHKDKPEFIDDMIDTIANSVNTLQKLINNLSAESGASKENSCQLQTVLNQCIKTYSNDDCDITLLSQLDNIWVKANCEDLTVQIGHIIRNAQQANCSEIYISISTIDDLIEIIFGDNGEGMSQDFIDNKLFKPFYTTKGAAGMGIGAYEVRKYARQIGGDVKVHSQKSKGTEFMISLPLDQTQK